MSPALELCARCTVRRQCAAEAIRLGTVDGVVAGVDLGNDSGKLVQSERDYAALAATASGRDISEGERPHGQRQRQRRPRQSQSQPRQH